MSPKDQAKMLEEAERPDDAASLRTEYKNGDKVKVTNGPFENFEGEVEEILSDAGKVRLLTTIFGGRRRWSWSTGRSRRSDRARGNPKTETRNPNRIRLPRMSNRA